MSTYRVATAASVLSLFATTVFAADTSADRKERAVKGPTISAMARQQTAAPGELIDVDVFINNVDDLSVYQLVVAVQNGNSGNLQLEELDIENDRPDYAFADSQVIKAVHLEGARMGAVQVNSSVDISRSAYLGTYRYRVSQDAAGVFSVGVKVDRESFLRNSQGTAIEFRPGKSANITVGDVATNHAAVQEK